MADMTQYSGKENGELIRLRQHCAAIRRNKDILWHVFSFLQEEPPNASAAQEAFEEIHFEDKIALYLAPSKGGIWETWERTAIKTGELGNDYEIWKARR